MFQSVERICVPSNSVPIPIKLVVIAGFNPSNGFVCLRTCTGFAAIPGLQRFNPSNGFVCLRTHAHIRVVGFVELFQSVERICVPSNHLRPSALWRYHHVSIRRTDLCAFEPLPPHGRQIGPQWRCFNPSNGFVCLRTRWRGPGRCVQRGVSIRRTDLCAFEH